MTLSDKTLAVAVANIGVQEVPKGSNCGPEVEVYLASVGLGKGYAWCMAFVYYCVDVACKNLGFVNPLFKTGGALKEWNTTTLPKILNTDTTVKAVDIFIMDFGGGVGHAGFVEKIAGGFIYTIEGNTNENGSQEGYEVARRKRAISSFKGFIQLPPQGGGVLPLTTKEGALLQTVPTVLPPTLPAVLPSFGDPFYTGIN